MNIEFMFGILFILLGVAFLVVNIILLIKKKKNKNYGVTSLMLNILSPFLFQIVNTLIFVSTISGPGSSNSSNPILMPITSLIIIASLSIINIILSCFILPKNNGGESTDNKTKQKEEKVLCSECGIEPEITNKVFAGQTEKLIIGLGSRHWYRVISHFNITYKCPQCGKIWTSNIKEETGKKVKQFDKKTRTWIDTDI